MVTTGVGCLFAFNGGLFVVTLNFCEMVMVLPMLLLHLFFPLFLHLFFCAACFMLSQKKLIQRKQRQDFMTCLLQMWNPGAFKGNKLKELQKSNFFLCLYLSSKSTDFGRVFPADFARI